MNIPELKSLFSQSKNTQVLLETLQENELSHIQLKGLMGSSPAFFSQALFQQFPINQLFILNDKEEAAYFLNDLEQNKIVICAGGIGNPYFTTDTTAALRAAELHSEVILKATKVDGVYDADPEKVEGAKKYDRISFAEAMEKDLKIMDQTAFSLCRENSINIVVFNMGNENAILNAAEGKSTGTIVS